MPPSLSLWGRLGAFLIPVTLASPLNAADCVGRGPYAHRTTRIAPGPPLAAAIQGHFAYVAGSGLWILDVSDPSSPVPVAWAPAGYALDVAVMGTHAYTMGGGFLQVVDVSNPASPVTLGSLALADTCSIGAIAGPLAYIPGAQSIHVVDVSNPAMPTPVGSLAGAVRDIAASGGIVSALTEAALQIIESGSAADPRIIASFRVDFPWSVAISGSLCLTTSWYIDHFNTVEQVERFDVSHPRQLPHLGTVSSGVGVAVSGSRVYLTGDRSSTSPIRRHPCSSAPLPHSLRPG